MKATYLWLLTAVSLAFSAPTLATTKTCPDGSKVPHDAVCPTPPPEPEPDPVTPAPQGQQQDQNQQQNQDQNQQQNQEQTANGGSATAKGGAGGNGGNGGDGGTGIGMGGVGSVGDTTATGGSATGGSATGGAVGDVGNNSGNSTNQLGQSSNVDVGVGDTTSTSGATSGSLSGVDIGDTTTSSSSNGTNTSKNTNAQGQSSNNTNALVGGNTGGNRLSNGSSSGGNSMTGGDVANHNAASNNGSGNSDIQIDSSNRSQYYSKTVFIPAIVPPTPASVQAVGNIVKETTACGPLMSTMREPIFGTIVGAFGGQRQVPQGWQYDLVPVMNPDGTRKMYYEQKLSDGSVRLYGSQAFITWAVIGTASARNLTIGGGSSEGGWGQGGAGSTASIQRIATNIQLVGCEIGTMTRAVEYIEVPVRKGGG